MAVLTACLHAQYRLPYACAGSRAAYGVVGLPHSVFHWEVTGGNVVANFNDTIVVEWGTNRVPQRITVTEITQFDCIGAPLNVNVNVRGPVINLAPRYEICSQDTLAIDATTAYDTDLIYRWHDGSTGPIYRGYRQDQIVVTVTGLDGCSHSDSALLTVNPRPVVDLGSDTSFCDITNLILDAGMFASYSWSTGQFSNPIQVTSVNQLIETISVTVTDYNGCTATDSMRIYQCSVDDFTKQVPNTFTPNMEGPNKTWKIDFLNLFPGSSVEIFDRWGRLIYRVADPDPMNVWDGKSHTGRDMPMDSYFYVINIRRVGGELEQHVGSISLIR